MSSMGSSGCEGEPIPATPCLHPRPGRRWGEPAGSDAADLDAALQIVSQKPRSWHAQECRRISRLSTLEIEELLFIYGTAWDGMGIGWRVLCETLQLNIPRGSMPAPAPPEYIDPDEANTEYIGPRLRPRPNVLKPEYPVPAGGELTWTACTCLYCGVTPRAARKRVKGGNKTGAHFDSWACGRCNAGGAVGGLGRNHASLKELKMANDRYVKFACHSRLPSSPQLVCMCPG